MYNQEYGYSNKVPYDNQPISRDSNANNNSNNNKRTKLSGVDILQFVLCVVLIVAIGFLAVQIKDIQNERGVYNVNVENTSPSNLSFATAKGMLSTVSVGTTINARSIKTEAEFFSDSVGCDAFGSGVIFSLEKSSGTAYIITNNHVIAGFANIYVLLWDSEVPIKATLVGGTSKYDIAVLKIENSDEIKNSACVAVEIAQSTDLVLGESCIVIGNSMGKNLRITSGVISVEEIVFLQKQYSTDYVVNLSHSADVNGGNSGGGLYNDSGKLIGIVNAKYNDVIEVDTKDYRLRYSEVVHGMNYAIPSSVAVAIAKNIIRNEGTLRAPNLGLSLYNSYLWKDKTEEINDRGLQTKYALYMIANDGEFRIEDEFVSVEYEFGGQTIIDEVDHISSLDCHMYNWYSGMTVKFKILRNGSEQTITANVSSTIKVS